MLNGLLHSKLLTKIERKPSDLEETFVVHMSDKMLIGSNIHRAYPMCNYPYKLLHREKKAKLKSNPETVKRYNEI